MRWTVLLSVVLSASVAAQDRNIPALPHADSSDDIVVSALRIPRQKLPTGVYWSYQSIQHSRVNRENADQFIRCALKPDNLQWMRTVVDGEPNSASARYAQGRIIEANGGCYPPIKAALNVPSNMPAATIDFGASRLDRGVIVESALKTYAPDAALTAKMTMTPEVRSRFVRREEWRNRMRLRDDRDALVLASCLVERQPVLATRLYRSKPGSTLELGLVQAILVEGRGCLGDTKRVTIDPTFARTYVIDAFYRWVVAARGVDSLLPPKAAG